MSQNNRKRNHDNYKNMEKRKDARLGIKKIVSNYNKIRKNQLSKMKLVKYIINDLKNYGPACLIHMNAISIVIDKPIQVWTSCGRLYRTINNRIDAKSTLRLPIDVQFHEQTSSIGHWTLFGNRDPTNVVADLNSCLFTVIAEQIKRSTNDVRTEVINYLSKNRKELAKEINEFVNTNNCRPALMIGGARYVGRSPADAAKIMDNSQNVLCHGCRDYGHPRSHASNKRARGSKDSVENYSRFTGTRKSGFLSRKDQNKVAHTVLTSQQAKTAMVQLNKGAISQSITLSRQELNNNNGSLPKMKEYYNGEEFTGELNIIRVTIVLRHHKNEEKNPDADVFVHTFYPRSS